MPKSHPILFSTAMVEAILDGRKTMTRRAIKPQPDDDGLWNHTAFPISILSDLEGWHGSTKEGESIEWKCPYGEVGDVLWIRETWQYIDFAGDYNGYVYKASENGRAWESNDESWTWRPSIFMPREACRIHLQITDIKVERLQGISEKDAEKEGVWLDKGVLPNAYTIYGMPHWETAKDCFKELWQGINGDASWDANPFVWVISFKEIDQQTA